MAASGRDPPTVPDQRQNQDPDPEAEETQVERTRPRIGPVDHSRLTSGLRTVRDRMADVRETAVSDDGLISVTLGARNELLELDLDPRVYRDQDSAALAADITATTHQAAERVRARLYELTRSTLAEPDPDTTDLAFDPMLEALDRGTGRSAR